MFWRKLDELIFTVLFLGLIIGSIWQELHSNPPVVNLLLAILLVVARILKKIEEA